MLVQTIGQTGLGPELLPADIVAIDAICKNLGNPIDKSDQVRQKI